MKAHGVDVVRWWVFPNFQGGGVSWDASGAPTGLGGSTVADIGAALDVAAQAGVRIEFTLFSFDSFKINVSTTTVNPHNLARPALRSSEADFLSRFRWSLQVFDISHEDSVFFITKEKVGSVATGESAGIALTGGSRCQINIVPLELTSLQMRDHFGQRLNTLCVRDFVK